MIDVSLPNRAIRLWTMMVLLVLSLMAGRSAAQVLLERIPADAVFYAEWQGAEKFLANSEGSNLQGLTQLSSAGEFIKTLWGQVVADEKKNRYDDTQLIQSELLEQVLTHVWKYPTAVYVNKPAYAEDEWRFAVVILSSPGKDLPEATRWLEEFILKSIPEDLREQLKIEVAGDVLMLQIGTVSQEALAVLSGKSPSNLKTAPAFTATMAQLEKIRTTEFSSPALFCYVDTPAWLEVFTTYTQATVDEEQIPSIMTLVDVLGARQIGPVGYAAGFVGKEWYDCLFSGRLGSDPLKGIAKLAAGTPFPEEAFQSVPQDAAVCMGGSVDLSGILQLVRESLQTTDDSDEIAAGFEQAIAMMSQGLGFDIETEFFNTFGKHWIAYFKDSMVLVNTLDDEETLKTSLKKFALMLEQMAPGYEPIVETFGEGDSSVEISTMAVHEEPDVLISWAVADGKLYVGFTQAIREAILQDREKRPSILENPDYAMLRNWMKQNPRNQTDSTILLHFTDYRKVYTVLYPVLTKATDMLGTTEKWDIPADLFPSPEKANVFLTPSMTTAWMQPQGCMLVSRNACPGLSMMIGPSDLLNMSLGTDLWVSNFLNARVKAKQNVDRSNLRMIGMECTIWASDHDGQMPDHLLQTTSGWLADSYKTLSRTFISPFSNTESMEITPAIIEEIKKDWTKYADTFEQHCDYIYLGKGIRTYEIDDPTTAIMAYTKPSASATGMSVLFVDGHVEWVPYTTSEELAELFEETNTWRTQNNLPPIDTTAIFKEATNK